jgi:hypothetical protein
MLYSDTIPIEVAVTPAIQHSLSLAPWRPGWGPSFRL